MGSVWSGGIDWELAGNGGPQCATYLSPTRQVLEFLCAIALSFICLFLGSALHNKPSPLFMSKLTSNTKITYGLLISMTATYLLEVAYKIYTHQAIFVFNPCHCICLVQMFILYRLCLEEGREPNLTTVYVFRIHLFFLHGPLMAVIFPVTNTLFLPGEVATYWIEHALLLGIPVYLLKGTNLTVPAKTWQNFFGWGMMAYGVWGIFHFLFLQPLASLTMANLNSMLCPAITDPFRGPYYRSYAIAHQFVITLICGCVVNALGKRDSHEKLMIE